MANYRCQTQQSNMQACNSGNHADLWPLKTIIKGGNKSDSSKSLGQAAHAIFLIDKIWRSVDSIVKIGQSEGIAAPAIPEEGR